MRDFDPAAPLIFIHVPKTAGQSVKRIFTDWYLDRIHFHYFDESMGRMPERIDLASEGNRRAPPVLYGHFNRLRGFGVEQYYPEVRQFVTILRDPFDMHVSRYHYTRREVHKWKLGSDIGDAGLAEHLEQGHLNMLEHFPRPVTTDNFKDIIEEYFVEIGCFEDLRNSLERIAARLGHAPGSFELPHLNASKEMAVIPPGARERFRDRWPLEFEVYDYVKQLSDRCRLAETFVGQTEA